jgi:UDP-N-acetylmuramoyl-tripeptide--D-alanyl-D-alanine ligase
MAAERNLQSDPERPYSLLLPYGLDYQGGVILFSDEKHPFLRILCGGVLINTNLVGSYNADNVMAAIAVGVHFGVSFEDAVKAIESYVPSNNRSQMTKTEHNTLIVDAYNANPTSMAAALENFSNVSADCRIAMLGDMLELGEDSAAEHEAVIASALSRNFCKVFFVGKEFAAVSVASDNAMFFQTSDELAEYLKSNPLQGASVLIKGSRGTRMEKVIPVL